MYYLGVSAHITRNSELLYEFCLLCPGGYNKQFFSKVCDSEFFETPYSVDTVFVNNIHTPFVKEYLKNRKIGVLPMPGSWQRSIRRKSSISVTSLWFNSERYQELVPIKIRNDAKKMEICTICKWQYSNIKPEDCAFCLATALKKFIEKDPVYTDSITNILGNLKISEKK